MALCSAPVRGRLIAGHYGWRLLSADWHPFAGGLEHHAACLEDDDGFEVELVVEDLSLPT